MALDDLRYGSFRPVAVQAEARALPGYGGQVEDWGTYRFMVEALEMKESQLSENERKKLGGLALRLTERLQGPALQIARSIGVEKLSKPDGVKVLLESLEKDLLPIRRQAALELYQAGSTSGLLSRQSGEPMSSYCLRREAWWSQLQDLDDSVKVSDSIRGEQLLQNSGLGQMEMRLVRTVCGNDLSDIQKLCNALRGQYGTIHEKERGQGGHRGFKGRSWHGSYKGGYGHGKGHGSSYMAEQSEDGTSPVSGGGSDEPAWTEGEASEWSYADDDWIEVEDEVYHVDETEEKTLEENVVCWFSEQGINAQTCSSEDLNMIYDAVDAELTAFYARGQISQRGYSAPASGGSYAPSGTMTPADRQARVLAAKQRTKCRACGQQGHWQHDAICPKRSSSKGYKGWSKGKSKGKGSGKHGKKGGDKQGGDQAKPRVVYFSIGELGHETEESFAGMVVRQERTDPETEGNEPTAVAATGLGQMPLGDLEREVHRLMRLPPEELDRQFNNEVNYMAPTPKAKAFMPSTPPRATSASTSQVFLTPGSDRGAYAQSSQASEPPRSPIPKAVPTTSTPTALASACAHENTTRRGANAYVDMLSCKDCGVILSKTKKETTKEDRPMHVQVPGTCGHHNVNWKGTNGYQWRWTCEDCARTESVRKEPGRERPVPGVNDGRVQVASTSASPAASLSRAGGVHDAEVLFGGSEEWYQYQSLLQRMVESHMELHGQMTRGEFTQMVNAVMICFRSFGLRTLQAGIPPLPSRSPSQHDALSTTTRSSTGGLSSAGLQRMTFGAHKGRTFTETYEQYPDYVDWTLSEAEHSAGFCAGMRKWMTYCHNRREDEIQGTVYMVAEEVGEEETDPDDVLLYLDSGCNVTCHGELWERRYVRATGNRPTWVHQGEGSLRGIGGGTRTTGVKEFYVGLEGENGEQVPGEIVSTEIAGSSAPLLLSIKSQQALGLVVDFAHYTVYSRLLDLTFKAVKGRKNGLIGLRMLPGPSVTDVTPVALMAEEDEPEGEETPPWRRGAASSSSRDRSRSRVTTGTMDVPGVQGFTRRRERNPRPRTASTAYCSTPRRRRSLS